MTGECTKPGAYYQVMIDRKYQIQFVFCNVQWATVWFLIDNKRQWRVQVALDIIGVLDLDTDPRRFLVPGGSIKI
jgi:hypothetical protein